ncbi:MAG: apo-citrate lyase phosphoribosyl-dephospho-CoA transferase [Thermococci archaeon]|nr:apo-citrate lyase phosphoribosyl-dephospho-CoA transferase [Thermococci archaeon]
MRSEDPWQVTRAFVLGPLLEATVPKPGNVSRFRDFSDLSIYNFLFAETAVMDVYYNVAAGRIRSVGRAVELAVRRSKEAQSANPNFGIVVLSVPLIMALRAGNGADARRDVSGVLRKASAIVRESTPEDSVSLYRAIRMASPKGLDRDVEYDVYSDDSLKMLKENDVNLWKLAEMSCGRELVFCEWLNGYRLTGRTVKRLEELFRVRDVEGAVRRAFIELMAEAKDTLIERRAGRDTAERVREMAELVLKGEMTVEELDAFLRRDERRNPGSLADVMASALSLVILRGYRLEGRLLRRTGFQEVK